jgi:hypothetical protein
VLMVAPLRVVDSWAIKCSPQLHERRTRLVPAPPVGRVVHVAAAIRARLRRREEPEPLPAMRALQPPREPLPKLPHGVRSTAWIIVTV